VVVRHPYVLNLHAVASTPDGRLLVTESAAATPLADLLVRRDLAPLEAVSLAAKLAEALQAFHDQGACHGRLSAEWLLVQSDLEPLLCPCGVPSQAPADRAQDLTALGRLLRQWLPSTASRWQRRSLAAVRQLCDAACQGQYQRAADLAGDLNRAVRMARIRWRERLAKVCALTVLLLPLPILAVGEFLDALRLPQDAGNVAVARFCAFCTSHRLLTLAPGAVVLGYAHGRLLVHRRRLRLQVSTPGAGRAAGMVSILLQVGLLTFLPGLLTWYSLKGSLAPGSGFALLPVGSGIMLGFYLVGIGLAATVTFAEWLLASLQAQGLGTAG
jgi:hypothetical protein